MQLLMKTGCLLFLLALSLPAQRMAGTYANLQAFLDSCPQNDVYTPIIRRDFQILRDQVAVGDIACTEPYTQMPGEQVTDELATLQALRFLYYMDMGRSGYLPWTPLRLYDWIKSRVSGVNIVTALSGGECCLVMNNLTYIEVGSLAAIAAEGNTSVAVQAQYRQTPDGQAANIAFFGHEARHTEGNGYLHVTGCPDFPTGGALACDESYDETNLSAYGIQYYLAAQMMTGGINLGYSCAPFTYTDADSLSAVGDAFAELANAFVGRFVTDPPPRLSPPADPGGPCIAASTFTLNSIPSLSIGAGNSFVVGVTASNSQVGWTADANVAWITPVLGMNSLGSGQVVFALSPAPGAQSATVIAAGLTFSVTCAAGCTGSTGGGPAITPGGIVPLFSSSTTIQAGSWISIYGSNLANTTAAWKGDFPTSLGGTAVTINRKPAYLSYVSPGQIDLQSPDDDVTGEVPVVVTTASGNATSSATLGAVSPSFSLLDTRHVAGIILRSNGTGAYGGGSYDILGPTGSSLGYATVAAKAGDIVVLFGVGFGPTNEQVPAGRTFSGAAPANNPVNLLINNINVAPSFAGLAGAGLYQINLTIPEGLGTGDVPLLANVASAQTPSNVVISLQ